MVTTDALLSTSPRAICFWLVFALCLVLGSVQFRNTWAFIHRLRVSKHEYLTKRKGSYAAELLIATTVETLVSVPLNLMITVVVPHSYATVWVCVRSFVHNSVVHAVAWLFVLRAWVLFTSLQTQRAAVRIQWESELHSGASNWYLRTQKTCGNPKWMQRVTIPFYAGMVIWLTIAPVIGERVFGISGYVALVIPMVVVALIWWRMPRIEDHFQIRNELKYTLFVMLICVVVFAIVVLGFQLHVLSLWHSLASAMALAMGCFGINMISVVWVLKKADESTRNRKLSAAEKMHGTNESGTVEMEPRRVSMTTLIADKNGFEAFMAHLQKEFATENLLFLWELMDYKHSFFDKFKLDKDFNFGFMLNLPRRDEVCKIYCGIEEPLERARYVWDKYLSPDAHLAVNIDFRRKHYLAKYFELGGLQQTSVMSSAMAYLFDDAGSEIYRLLNDSWSRFTNTKGYQRAAKLCEEKRPRSSSDKLCIQVGRQR